jgi:hypothetical protein
MTKAAALLLSFTPFLAFPLSPAFCQAPRPASAAAETITDHDVIRHIKVIADDSMLGRDTPSHGLEATAQYVASQFKAAGLKPAGDSGTWFQRYPITRRHIDAGGSSVTLRSGSTEARASLAAAARFVQGSVPEGSVGGEVLLLGGAITADAATGAGATGRIVLLVSDPQKPELEQAARALYLAGARAIILLADVDSAVYAPRLSAQRRDRTAIDLGLTRPAVVEVREGAVRRVLAAAGLDPVALRATTKPVIRNLPKLTATIALKEVITSRHSAPNTVGMIEGRDPKLKQEYVLFSAHMDHIGISPGQPDSINNGADDDASGTAAVIELASAFGRPDARPKRSLLFLTVSGEEKGLWGSRYFSEHPPVPINQIVADINIDMVGRNWPDSIVAIGKEHSDLGATLNRVNAEHPDLGMTAIDDRWPEERFYFRSDHYNFARKGVPILFFFNGVHPDYHRPSDSPDKINSEKEARIARLLFYLGEDIGNAPERPKWKPESYKEIVEQ